MIVRSIVFFLFFKLLSDVEKVNSKQKQRQENPTERRMIPPIFNARTLGPFIFFSVFGLNHIYTRTAQHLTKKIRTTLSIIIKIDKLNKISSDP